MNMTNEVDEVLHHKEKNRKLKPETVNVVSRIPYNMYCIFRDRVFEEGLTVSQAIGFLIESYINSGKK